MGLETTLLLSAVSTQSVGAAFALAAAERMAATARDLVRFRSVITVPPLFDALFNKPVTPHTARVDLAPHQRFSVR
jgi:hypothetical protein